MNECKSWSIRVKTNNAIVFEGGDIKKLGSYDSQYYSFLEHDYALADRLERNPFTIKVDNCICSDIVGQSFIDYEILQKDDFDSTELVKIQQCKIAAKKNNAIALFDYALYMISRAKSFDNKHKEDSIKIEQGLFLLKAAARLGHCGAIYAFSDFLMSYTFIDTGLVERWIETYLKINPCMKKELSILAR